MAGPQAKKEKPPVDVSTMSLKGIIKFAYEQERARLEKEKAARTVRHVWAAKELCLIHEVFWHMLSPKDACSVIGMGTGVRGMQRTCLQRSGHCKYETFPTLARV